MDTKRGLPPVVDKRARTLIVGSMPGDDSLRLQQYYAHVRNHFWPIIAKVFGEDIGGDYKERIDFIKGQGVALWDVLHTARRQGSLDSAIRGEVANDFATFLDEYPGIRAIGFNGRKAWDVFQKSVLACQRIAVDRYQLTLLPSSSPVPGRNVLDFEGKVERWREFLLG